MVNAAIPESKPRYILNGFNIGLKPKKIINLKRFNGTNYFLVKWCRTEDPTYLKAEVAKERCPLLVCEFYQKHTVIIDDAIVLKDK